MTKNGDRIDEEQKTAVQEEEVIAVDNFIGLLDKSMNKKEENYSSDLLDDGSSVEKDTIEGERSRSGVHIQL
jgi:hypothetical protein